MCVFFLKYPATTEIYPLSLHDALPIFGARRLRRQALTFSRGVPLRPALVGAGFVVLGRWRVLGPDLVEDVVQDRLGGALRSEEHTSELQSRQYLVCRLLLEKKKNTLSS